MFESKFSTLRTFLASTYKQQQLSLNEEKQKIRNNKSGKVIKKINTLFKNYAVNKPTKSVAENHMRKSAKTTKKNSDS